MLLKDGREHTGLGLGLGLLLGCFAVGLALVQRWDVIRSSYRGARGLARGHPGPGEGCRPGPDPDSDCSGSKNTVSVCTSRPDSVYKNNE